MYKVLVNTADVVQQNSTPLRTVLSQKTQQKQIWRSQSNKHKITCSRFKGDVHLFRQYLPEGQNGTDQSHLQANKIDIKTQILMVTNIVRQQLADLLAIFEQRQQNIDLIQVVQLNSKDKELYTIFIYFKTIVISQQVYNMLVYEQISLTLYLKEVVILPQSTNRHNLMVVNQFKDTKKDQKQIVTNQKWIELPTCLACLQKIQYNLTGISPYLFKKQTNQNCRTCQLIKHKGDDQCQSCHSSQNIWICMVCSRVGCGRYKNADAYKHFMADGHILTLDLQTERVWNYLSDCFSHRIIPFEKQQTTLKFPQYNNQINNPKYQESLQGAFWEYCSVVSEQLDRQRTFYQRQKNQEQQQYKLQNDKMQQAIKALENQLQEKQSNLKKHNKKVKKNQRRIAELKQYIKEERYMLGNYEKVIRQGSQLQPSLEEIGRNSQTIRQKYAVLQKIQQEIAQVLQQLSF